MIIIQSAVGSAAPATTSRCCVSPSRSRFFWRFSVWAAWPQKISLAYRLTLFIRLLKLPLKSLLVTSTETSE
jgi:hypothetical protein